MRALFLILAIGGFAGLGLLDLAAGRLAAGVAALLLATANFLLLS
jgi:hypothetical protein